METIKSVIYNSCTFERYKSDDIKDVPKYLWRKWYNLQDFLKIIWEDRKCGGLDEIRWAMCW